MLLKGNAYALIKRDTKGNPVELIFIPSDAVTIVNISSIDYFSDIKYNVVGIDRIIEHTDMLHFMNVTYDGIQGVSTICAASLTLGLAYNSEYSANTFFTSGNSLSGILTVDGTVT
jgi:HK97 family phage portal protein